MAGRVARATTSRESVGRVSQRPSVCCDAGGRQSHLSVYRSDTGAPFLAREEAIVKETLGAAASPASASASAGLEDQRCRHALSGAGKRRERGDAFARRRTDGAQGRHRARDTRRRCHDPQRRLPRARLAPPGNRSVAATRDRDCDAGRVSADGCAHALPALDRGLNEPARQIQRPEEKLRRSVRRIGLQGLIQHGVRRATARKHIGCRERPRSVEVGRRTRRPFSRGHNRDSTQSAEIGWSDRAGFAQRRFNRRILPLQQSRAHRPPPQRTRY